MPRNVPPVQVRVDAATKQRWQQAADLVGLSLAEFVRKATDNFVNGIALSSVAPSFGFTVQQGKRSYTPDPKGPKR